MNIMNALSFIKQIRDMVRDSRGSDEMNVSIENMCNDFIKSHTTTSAHMLPIESAPINGELIILARLDKDGEVEELDAGLWEHDAGQDTSNGYIEPSHYWRGLRGEMHPTHWCPMPGICEPSQEDILAENVSLKSELREARIWLEGKDAVIEALTHRAGTCQVPPKGWACTREAGHEGPCAAFPTSIPDETS